jgi:hypothetical protein
MRSIAPQLGSPSLELEKKLVLVTNRLAAISPSLASFITKEYTKFWKDVQFLDNVILNDIPDSDHLYIPKGCEIQQIAIQRKPEFAEDKRYFVSNDLWKTLNSDNKFALVLHEIVYNIAIENGHENSRRARHLNSLLLSDKIINYKGIKFAELAAQLNMQDPSFTYVYNDYEFRTAEYSPDLLWIGGELLTTSEVVVSGNKLKVSKISFYKKEYGRGLFSLEVAPGQPSKLVLGNSSGTTVNANICGYINFYPEGNIKHLFGCAEPFKNYIQVNNQSIQFSGHIGLSQEGDVTFINNPKTPYLHFYLNNWIPIYGNLSFISGNLITDYIYVYQTIDLNIGGVIFTVEKDSQILMSPVGELTFIYFNGHTSSVKLKPQQNSFKCSFPIAFYNNSSLKRCMIASDGNGIQLVKRSGETVRARGGNTVTFDVDGFLIEVRD